MSSYHMKLLRSVIEFDQEVSCENLVRNFQMLRRAIERRRVVWTQPADESIYRYCGGYFAQHFAMPSYETVGDYFRETNNIEVLDRIKYVANEPPYARTNYKNLVQVAYEEQREFDFKVGLAETSALLKGVKNKKTGEVDRGFKPSADHIKKLLHRLQAAEDERPIHRSLRDQTERLWERYERAKLEGPQYGALSGLREFDDNTLGVKPGELWIHGGFPGELKTTMALNWGYNCCTRYRTSVVFVSLEMTMDQLEMQFAALHTGHPKFTSHGYRALDQRLIETGKLSEAQEEYFRLVLDDLKGNPNYATWETVQPCQAWNMDDIRAQLEAFQREFDVGLVVIDHGQRVRARERNKDYTIEMNSVVQDCKSLAMNFNGGAGVPVLLLWQINREGKEDANKNDGVYQARAFTYANAVEKEADVITASYLNEDLRRLNRCKITNIKNRHAPIIAPFELKTGLSIHSIRSFASEIAAQDDSGIGIEEV